MTLKELKAILTESPISEKELMTLISYINYIYTDKMKRGDFETENFIVTCYKLNVSVPIRIDFKPKHVNLSPITEGKS